MHQSSIRTFRQHGYHSLQHVVCVSQACPCLVGVKALPRVPVLAASGLPMMNALLCRMKERPSFAKVFGPASSKVGMHNAKKLVGSTSSVCHRGTLKRAPTQSVPPTQFDTSQTVCSSPRHNLLHMLTVPWRQGCGTPFSTLRAQHGLTTLTSCHVCAR